MNSGLLRRELLALLTGAVAAGRTDSDVSPSVAGRSPVDGVGAVADGDAASSWPRFKFDASNTGFSTSASGPRDGVTESWRYRTGGGWNAPPVVDDDTVYVGGDGLYALDRETGVRRWEFRNGEKLGFSGPSVGEGVVCCVNLDDYHNVLYGVNAADGSERWSHELGGQVLDSPVTVVDGTVYVTGPDETHAIDVSSGEHEWAVSPGMGVEDNSVPAVTSDTVYVSDSAGLRALDRSDGSERWTYDISDSLSPAVDGDRVYVGGYQGDQWRVVGVDAETGTGEWQATLGETDVGGSPTLLDGRLFVSAGNLRAFDTDSGEELWTSPHGGGGIGLGSPVTDGELLYAVNTASNYVAALDPGDGSLQWRFELEAPGSGNPETPALAGDTVFAHGSHTLHALVPDNDPPVADVTHEPSEPTTGEPVTFDASEARDPDGSVTSYEWDVGDDGTVDATGETATVTFSEARTHTVALTVEDGQGATDTIRTSVSVVESNDPPSPAISISPSNPRVDQEVTFDASRSSDPDGSVASYEWDLTGDGTADATGETVTHAFESPGSRRVELTVTDDDGAVRAASRSVSVSAGTAATDAGIDPETGSTATRDASTDTPIAGSGGGSPVGTESAPAAGGATTATTPPPKSATGVLAAVLAQLLSAELLVVVGVAVVAVLIVLTWERQVEGR